MHTNKTEGKKIILYFLLILIFTIVGALLILHRDDLNYGIPNTLLELVWIVTLFVIFKFDKNRLKTINNKGLSIEYIVYSILIASLIGLIRLFPLVIVALTNSTFHLLSTIGITPLPSSPILFFTTATILGPIQEELFFRGILLNYLKQKHSLIIAVVLSSLLFSLIHLTPQVIICDFITGIILSYFYVKWGNITYPVIMHTVVNFSAIIPVLVQLIAAK